ncbi:MAG TPA: hypothetical protein VJA21_28830 [Verrucomicrobiae bacterium]
MTRIATTSLLALLLITTGCVSYIQAPEAIGRVYDAETGQPLRGARVTRSAMNQSWYLPQGLPEKTVTTGRYGRFRVPEARGWDLLLHLHETPESFTAGYRIDADGYTGTNVTGFANSNTLWRVELGHIDITRQ